MYMEHFVLNGDHGMMLYCYTVGNVAGKIISKRNAFIDIDKGIITTHDEDESCVAVNYINVYQSNPLVHVKWSE